MLNLYKLKLQYILASGATAPRFRRHMKVSCNFPHQVGLVLTGVSGGFKHVQFAEIGWSMRSMIMNYMAQPSGKMMIDGSNPECLSRILTSFIHGTSWQLNVSTPWTTVQVSIG